MSPFLHILSRQIPSWLSGWLTVKSHECALLGVLGAPHASAWHLAPFDLCLDDTRPLQAEVPLLSTVALRLPPHPTNISLSNLLLTTTHSKQPVFRCTSYMAGLKSTRSVLMGGERAWIAVYPDTTWGLLCLLYPGFPASSPGWLSRHCLLKEVSRQHLAVSLGAGPCIS